MLVKEMISGKDIGALTVRPSMSVHNASRLMSKKNIGALLVSSNGREAQGILTERDILHGVAERGARFLEAEVAEVCVRDVRTCTPDTDMNDVMFTMHDIGARHMPVESNGSLVGIVSLQDILNHHVAVRRRG